MLQISISPQTSTEFRSNICADKIKQVVIESYQIMGGLELNYEYKLHEYY